MLAGPSFTKGSLLFKCLHRLIRHSSSYECGCLLLHIWMQALRGRCTLLHILSCWNLVICLRWNALRIASIGSWNVRRKAVVHMNHLAVHVGRVLGMSILWSLADWSLIGKPSSSISCSLNRPSLRGNWYDSVLLRNHHGYVIGFSIRDSFHLIIIIIE